MGVHSHRPAERLRHKAMSMWHSMRYLIGFTLAVLLLAACNANDLQQTRMILAVAPNPVAAEDEVTITVQQPAFPCEGNFLPLVAKYVDENAARRHPALDEVTVTFENGSASIHYPPNSFDEGVHPIRIISTGCNAYDTVNLMVGETAYVGLTASKAVVPVSTTVTLTAEVTPGLCTLTPGTPVLFSKDGDGDTPATLVGTSVLQVVYSDQDGIADPEGKDIVRAFATLEVAASTLAQGASFYSQSISAEESYLASDVVIRANVASSTGKNGCPAAALPAEQDLRLTVVDVSLPLAQAGANESLLTAISPLNVDIESFLPQQGSAAPQLPAVQATDAPATAVPATSTNTAVPTATNTPLPTDTNTPLPTSTFTNTPLPTDTNTPLPTSTFTNTPLPTDTNTPLPTDTNTPLPTDTNTPLPTDTPTPLPTATFTNTPVIDQDGDGVPDSSDSCVLIPGLPQHSGCPDADGDGWPEGVSDFCPDVFGNFEGCPDTDGDGWHDGVDACPIEADALDGCPDPLPGGLADPGLGGGGQQAGAQYGAVPAYQTGPVQLAAISTPAAPPFGGSPLLLTPRLPR